MARTSTATPEAWNELETLRKRAKLSRVKLAKLLDLHYRTLQVMAHNRKARPVFVKATKMALIGYALEIKDTSILPDDVIEVCLGLYSKIADEAG